MTTSEPRAPRHVPAAQSRDASNPAQPASFLAAFLRALIHPPKVSRGRYILAMSVAVVADLLFWWLGELLPVASDFVVAVILALCLGGLRFELLVAFLCEATPGLGLLPSWSLAVPIVWMRANATVAPPETSATPSNPPANAASSTPSNPALPPAHPPALPPIAEGDSNKSP